MQWLSARRDESATNTPAIKRESFVGRRRKRRKGPEGPFKGAETSEELAKRYFLSQMISADTVLEVLQATEIPMNSTRKNVLPSGVDAVQGMLLGFYAFASVGITEASKSNEWLTRFLSSFVQKSYPDFEFTSIQVNKNYASRPHVDKNNLGESLIIGLGDYTGGEIWVHDETGDVPFRLDESISCMYHYEEGATYSGSVLDPRGQWSRFNGSRLHFTKPFEGERFSLVYYTCSRYSDASEELRSALRAAGFPFPKSEKLDMLLSSKEEERRQCSEKWKQVLKERAREAKEELGRCNARTWNKGWGGCCANYVSEAGDEFCNMHVKSWKTHGAIHGTIPFAKMAEMRKAQRQMRLAGEQPPDPLPPGAMLVESWLLA